MRVLTTLAAVVAFGAAMAGQSSSKQYVPAIGSSSGPVSRAVRAGGLVHVSTWSSLPRKVQLVRPFVLWNLSRHASAGNATTSPMRTSGIPS
jgi:hypothetical protein